MTFDPQFQAKYERLKKNMEDLRNTPPLEKARIFLKEFCAPNADLEEVEDHVRHALNFNAIPILAGLEGLETVLADKNLPAQTLVSLALIGANSHTPPFRFEEARQFLEQLVAMLRLYFPLEYEAEGVCGFDIDEVFILRPRDKPERLRCIDMVGVDSHAYAVLVPEHATEKEGPFTIYRYHASMDKPLEYSLITDAELVERVLLASRT